MKWTCLTMTLLAQAAPVVSQVDAGWERWAQLGIGSCIAIYLIVYEMPRQRREQQAALQEMQSEFLKTIAAQSDDCHEEAKTRSEIFKDTLDTMANRFDQNLREERAAFERALDKARMRHHPKEPE